MDELREPIYLSTLGRYFFDRNEILWKGIRRKYDMLKYPT